MFLKEKPCITVRAVATVLIVLAVASLILPNVVDKDGRILVRRPASQNIINRNQAAPGGTTGGGGGGGSCFGCNRTPRPPAATTTPATTVPPSDVNRAPDSTVPPQTLPPLPPAQQNAVVANLPPVPPGQIGVQGAASSNGQTTSMSQGGGTLGGTGVPSISSVSGGTRASNGVRVPVRGFPGSSTPEMEAGGSAESFGEGASTGAGATISNTNGSNSVVNSIIMPPPPPPTTPAVIADQNRVVICIAVIDHTFITATSHGIPDAELATRWGNLRTTYPDRPFCLLQSASPPAGSSLYANGDFNTRPELNTHVRNVPREAGPAPQATTDWYTSCGLDKYYSLGYRTVNVYTFTGETGIVGALQLSEIDDSWAQFNTKIAANGFTSIGGATPTNPHDYISSCLGARVV